jgi:hypothetical protein
MPPASEADRVMRVALRLTAVVAAFASIHNFGSWMLRALLLRDDPELASLVAMIPAVLCSGFVWRKVSVPQDLPDKVKAAFGQEHLLRVTFWSAIAGAIGFAGGFVGPMILAPKNNLGPLLGIFITGPAGVLLGPALGVATRIRGASLESSAQAWRWLVVGWLLVCGYYSLAGKVVTIAAMVAVGLMLAYLIVGVALAVHVESLSPSTKDKGHAWILLAGGALVIFLSLFPPVSRPTWGKVPLGAVETAPRFAFLFNEGFDASHRVPIHVIDVTRWILEVLAVAGACAAAHLALAALDRRRH